MFIQNQRVVCLSDVFPDWVKELYLQLPVKDQNYTIRDVGIGLDVKAKVPTNKVQQFTGVEEITVWVNELHNPIHPFSKLEYGFLSERFAPLEELSEEQIEEMVSDIEFVETDLVPLKKELQHYE